MKNQRHIRFLTCGDEIPSGQPRKYRNSGGYVRLRWPDGDGFVEALEHRVVMGLPPADISVHHINMVRHDNRPENLQLIRPSDHASLHNPTEFDVDEAVRLYALGLSTLEIGVRLGVDPSNVYRQLDRRGVPLRSLYQANAQRVDVDRELVRSLHLSDIPAPQIAEQLGVPIVSVRRVIRELGLPRRRAGNPLNQKRRPLVPEAV